LARTFSGAKRRNCLKSRSRCILLRPGLYVARGRLGQRLHEVLTQGGLDVVRLVRNRGG
jgi:hypothetical protein